MCSVPALPPIASVLACGGSQRRRAALGPAKHDAASRWRSDPAPTGAAAPSTRRSAPVGGASGGGGSPNARSVPMTADAQKRCAATTAQRRPGSVPLPSASAPMLHGHECAEQAQAGHAQARVPAIFGFASSSPGATFRFRVPERASTG